MCDLSSQDISNNVCVDRDNVFQTNGLTLLPFVRSGDQFGSTFTATSGTDEAAFGIPANDYFLEASGNVSSL